MLEAPSLCCSCRKPRELCENGKHKSNSVLNSGVPVEIACKPPCNSLYDEGIDMGSIV